MKGISNVGKLVCLLVAVVVVSAETGAEEARPPNIVYILADDLGIGDPGCYNAQSKIPTPHIDRIAKEGMRFTDAHSGSAVCTPTRYGILTGRYAWRSRLKQGVLGGYSRALIEPGRLTVAEVLKEHGYATACVGKWHLGFQAPDLNGKDLPNASRTLSGDHPQAVDYGQALRPGPTTEGFDYYFGIPASLDMEPYVYVEGDRVAEAPTEFIQNSLHRRQGGNGFWRAGPIAPSFKHAEVLPAITKKALAWLKQQSQEKPFFLYFALTAPHTPWLPTAEFQGRSKVGYYGDFVMEVDAVIGQVLESLDQIGLADNTLLIVTSDNGSHWPVSDIEKWGHAANLHYRGQKSDIWEGGHRVPFVARWPGKIQAGSTCEETICHVDFFATAAAILEHELPADAAEDSFNLLPALRGHAQSGPIRPATVHHSGSGTFAIRQGKWKLVAGNLGSGGFSDPKNVPPEPDGPQGQLYDLSSDIGETTNLYVQHPEIAEKLYTALEEIKKNDRSRPGDADSRR
jgi:arylsulfatase A-like enzyme